MWLERETGEDLEWRLLKVKKEVLSSDWWFDDSVEKIVAPRAKGKKKLIEKEKKGRQTFIIYIDHRN